MHLKGTQDLRRLAETCGDLRGTFGNLRNPQVGCAQGVVPTAVQGGPTYGEKIYCSEISAVQFLDQRF